MILSTTLSVFQQFPSNRLHGEIFRKFVKKNPQVPYMFYSIYQTKILVDFTKEHSQLRGPSAKIENEIKFLIFKFPVVCVWFLNLSCANLISVAPKSAAMNKLDFFTDITVKIHLLATWLFGSRLKFICWLLGCSDLGKRMKISRGELSVCYHK